MTTRFYIAEGHDVKLHRHENLKSRFS